MSSSVVQGEQPFECRLGLDCLVNFEDVVGVDIDRDLRRLRDGLGEFLVEVLDLFGGRLREDVIAPDAGVLLAGRLLFAARADDGPGVVGLVGGDVQAVGLRDLAFVRIVEDGDVPGGDLTPARPAVMVFEVGLGDALAREVGRRGLPEDSRRDRLRDVCPVGDVFQRVTDAIVRDCLSRGELAPQRVRVATWVVIQPATDVRHRRDEDRRPTAGLPVERDLEAVVVVNDVRGCELEQLARTRPEVPRERDQRSVAGVVAGVEHRLDVVAPVEHGRRVRRRVVVLGIAAGDPLDRVGEPLTVGGELADSAQGDAIVLVRLGALGLFSVDPLDDLLGGVTVVHGVGEAPDGLRHPDAPSEDELVALRRVLAGAEDADLVRYLEEDLSVGLRDVILARLQLVPHRSDGSLCVVAHRCHNATADGHVKPRCEALPGHNSETLHAHGEDAGITPAYRGHSLDESYVAIDKSPASAGANGGVLA